MDLAVFNFSTAIQIRFKDMDAFNHVNNAVHLTYFEVARTKYWRDLIKWNWDEAGIIVARAEVDFLKPITLNDEIRVYVRTSRVGASSFDLEYAIVSMDKESKELVHSIGKTICVSFDYIINKPIPIPAIPRENMEKDLRS
jgi:acyl-CoA thioester hydrolase